LLVPPAEILLAALQHGDSAFPAGGFAFSWGVEGLIADGLLATPDDLARVVREVLLRRWASFDRPVLRRAFDAAPDEERVADVDRDVETATIVAGLREGSRRAGRALLGAHVRLATPGAVAYRARVDADSAPGHQSVVQGLVWRGVGLPLAAAEAMAAWAVVSSMVSAGVRLGALGHAAAQTLLTRLRPEIAALLAAPPPPAPLHAFTPLADIAVARHARRDLRLFAT
jgi:urease accessory protein